MKLFYVFVSLLLSFVLIPKPNQTYLQNYFLSPKSDLAFFIPEEVVKTHFTVKKENLFQVGSLFIQKEGIPTEDWGFDYPAYCTQTKQKLTFSPYSEPLYSRYWPMEMFATGEETTLSYAWDAQEHKVVVIKSLENREYTNAFFLEFELLKSLSHPNIVTVYEMVADETEPFIFYVMEKIEGADLKQLPHPMKTEAILEIALQLADALEELHKNGIIHRDIKPENMIWDGQKLTLIDFGIASKNNPKNKALQGTPAYMSPEQANLEPLDHTTDIYSFGAVLYELFTGKPPYQEKVKTESDTRPALPESKPYNLIAQTKNQQWQEDRTPARSLNPEIPEEIENIINKAMSFNKKDRFQTIQEMKKELQALLRKKSGLHHAEITNYSI